MDAEAKTKAQLIIEISRLRQQVADLEAIAEAANPIGKRLYENEQRFRKIVEDSPAGYFYINRSGRFQHVNQAWLRMHGYASADEVLGQHFALTQLDQDLEKAQAVVDKLLQGEVITTGEFTRRSKDGTVGYHTFSAAPVIRNGEIVGLEGFLIDATEHKQAEKALRQRNAALTALNAITVTMSQHLAVNHIVDAALEKILEVTEATAGAIHLYRDENNEALELAAVRGFEPDAAALTSWARLELPIKGRDRVLGRLELYHRSPRYWDNQDQDLLTAIGYEVGLGITNARLFGAVRQQSEQLRTLGTQLVEAEEAERRRLARELHDQVGQSLTAMGINLDIIRTLLAEDIPEEIIARLDDTRSLVTRTTKRVRQVMVDLRPEALDDYGVLAALHWAAKQFTKRTDIPVVVEGEEAGQRLSMQLENVLYRVAREALNNVAKHAQATQVMVSLTMSSEAARLVVADDGIGFSPKQRSTAKQGQEWGLAIMAERVEGVGGHFSIESSPGQGTRVIAEVFR